jgi:hypothetical protein
MTWMSYFPGNGKRNWNSESAIGHCHLLASGPFREGSTCQNLISEWAWGEESRHADEVCVAYEYIRWNGSASSAVFGEEGTIVGGFGGRSETSRDSVVLCLRIAKTRFTSQLIRSPDKQGIYGTVISENGTCQKYYLAGGYSDYSLRRWRDDRSTTTQDVETSWWRDGETTCRWSHLGLA